MMNQESRKEFADIRLRPTNIDRRFKGMARIPQARAWLLRRLDEVATIADDQAAGAAARTRAKAEVRSLTDRLRRLGVIDDG